MRLLDASALHLDLTIPISDTAFDHVNAPVYGFSLSLKTDHGFRMQALLHAPQRAPCGALSRTPVPIVPIFRPVPYAPAATCPFPVPRDLPCSMSKPATFGLLLTVESQPPCPPLHHIRRHAFILFFGETVSVTCLTVTIILIVS